MGNEHTPRISILEISQQQVDKLANSVDKLVEVTHTFAVGLAAHTERLNTVETNQNKQDANIRVMAETSAAMISTIVDKHSQDYREVNAKIDGVKDTFKEELSEQTKNLTGHMDHMQTALTDKFSKTLDAVDKRVNALEQWRWLVIGGCIVVMSLLAGIGWKLAQTWLQYNLHLQATP